MIFRLAVAGAVAAMHVSAQDPTQTLPQAYRVQFENDYVRVVRVRYEAGAQLPEHTHPPGTTVYVYLNDSDGVVFRHSGRSNRAVTRPAVVSGSVRVASGQEEHHTAENPASTPTDFLRVLLKTESTGGRTMRRLSLADRAFENKQLKITRLTAGAGKTVISATDTHPALLIALPSGETRWLEPRHQQTLDAGEYLQIDLLTPPR